MYLHRHIEKTLKESLKEFPVVALMGPRQVGKTTLIRELFAGEYEYITLDDLSLRSQAQADPALFIRNHPGKLIIDEIQYAPKLLSEIKIAVDTQGKPGQYILTGSQQFQVMNGLRESLAGRVLLLNLFPMTVQEKAGLGAEDHWLTGILSGKKISTSLFQEFPSRMKPIKSIVEGGLPGLLTKSEKFHHAFFESYMKTYIERDLPNQFDIKESGGMIRFISLIAAQTSCEINKSQTGRELSVSPPTANRWLGWLRESMIWNEHPPYHGNIIKRVSKHPKGYLFDTGLCSYLLRISGQHGLETHPAVGNLFETAMRIEFDSVISSTLTPARCYHWRTQYGHEADIVIEFENRLYAFECKWSAAVSKKETKGLVSFLEYYGEKAAFCGIIVPFGRPMLLEEGIYQIPWFLRV
jgi:predicted AAA+ superfamily ATPase